MDRRKVAEAPPGSLGNPIPLPREKKLLHRYYSGERLRSPMGGFLDVLGVREGEGGGGRVLFECNTSSLRFVLLIPKATKAERSAIHEVLEAGDDAHCPRHGLHQRLVKSGKKWLCPLCGVVYAKSP